MAHLSVLGELVRRHDPDRYLTTLFAPAAQREVLFTLYAFNHELARAREAVREPMAALIRLQWWREVIEGARRRHEVAGPLGAALDAGTLAAADLLGMIDAREAETEPMDTLAAFEAYLLGSAGGVMVAAGRALGAMEPETLRLAGAAYGMAGVLRSVPALARRGRCLLPADTLATAGLSAAAVIAAPDTARAVTATLAAVGLAWATPVPAVGRTLRAAVLPLVLARRDLVRDEWPAARGLGDRLAVMLAALRGP